MIVLNKNLIKNKRLILVFILFFALFLRLNHFYSSYLPLEKEGLRIGWADEYNYYSLAEIIADKGILSYFRDIKSLWTTPGNPLYLSILISNNISIKEMRYINIFMSILLVYLIYILGKKVHSESVGLISAFFAAIIPSLIILSPLILTETIFLILFIISITFLVDAFKTEHNKYFILSGIFLGLATLVRGTLMLFPMYILFCLIILYFSKKISRTFLKKIIIFVCISSAIIVPYIAKNAIMFGKFSIANGTGTMLYLGSRMDTEGDEPPVRGKQYETFKITAPYEHLDVEGDKRLRDAGIANIKEHTFKWALWTISRPARLLVGNNYSWFEMEKNWFNYTQKHGFKQGLKQLRDISFVAFLVVFGTMGIVRNLKRREMQVIFWMSSYYVLIHMPFLVNMRYGLPVLILLMVATALEINYFYNTSSIGIFIKTMFNNAYEKFKNNPIFLNILLFLLVVLYIISGL